MDRIKEIFEFYKEAIVTVKDNKIWWCNSAAYSFFGNEKKIEIFKSQVLSAFPECEAEDFAMALEIDDVKMDVVASKIDEVTIISVLQPENTELDDFKNMFSNIEASAKGAMALFNMSSSKLRDYIENINDAKLSTYAAIQSHSYYSLAYLISNISKLSTAGKKLKDSDKKYFNIAETCEDLIEETNKVIKCKDVQIRLVSDEKYMKFFGNEEMIYIALIKLLSNSMKYVEKGDKILVSLRLKGKYLSLSVSDTGVGIPKDKMLGIFSWYRMKRDFKDNKEGIGIGLYIVKQIATMHEGTVLLESEEGKGTKVTMMLPVINRKNIQLTDRISHYNPSSHEVLTEFADALDYKSYMAYEI